MRKDVSLFDDDEAVIAEGYFIRWEIVIFILAAFFTIVALVVAVEEETPAPLLVPLLLFLWGWLVMKFSKRTLLVTNYRVCTTAFLGGFAKDISLDSITAVASSSWWKTLTISTKGGMVIIGGVSNADDLREAITGLIMEREAMLSFGLCRKE